MQQLAIAGATRVGGSSFDAFKSIQFHHSNILTSASFTPPPRKSWLQKLWETLCAEGRP
ncbi:hypothetical protein Q3V30_12945 [Erwinia pyri]|uniref:Uncharacterized protein n=1 Tax=Erwinia pyri TaxID=3062598 RepID=A0AA50HLF2_9GAMM|nr:hypothetical protein [Erwinia sp. DE2]WLS77392.1 hypothetical protein Q3V30_12945 [Erwinia sp. DE2]